MTKPVEVETTPRGFSVIEFKDHNRVSCSLQQSSAIDFSVAGALDRPGSSLLWLGCNDADPKFFVPNGDPPWRQVPMPCEYVANTRMHLGRSEVEMLVRHLQSWLETGFFVDRGVIATTLLKAAAQGNSAVAFVFRRMRELWPGEEFDFEVIFSSDGSVTVGVYRDVTEDTCETEFHETFTGLGAALDRLWSAPFLGGKTT